MIAADDASSGGIGITQKATSAPLRLVGLACCLIGVGLASVGSVLRLNAGQFVFSLVEFRFGALVAFWGSIGSLLPLIVALALAFLGVYRTRSAGVRTVQGGVVAGIGAVTMLSFIGTFGIVVHNGHPSPAALLGALGGLALTFGGLLIARF
jgi:hypothetical protein